MMETERIRGETDYFHAFPDAGDVFASRVAEHGEYLLPIATVSLNRVAPDLEGQLHLAMPIEPAAGWGCVGDRSATYHNYLCRPNWIGYRVVGGKLELACDFRYFHKAFFEVHPPKDDHAHNELADLAPHYEETRAEYECRRRYFRDHGLLINSAAPYREGEPTEVDAPWTSENGLPLSLVGDLGGQSVETNWAANFPLSIHSPARDETLDSQLGSINAKLDPRISSEASAALPIAVPKTEDGRDFTFVGCFEMGTYLGIEDGGMMVFYDRRDQIVLTTFDWS